MPADPVRVAVVEDAAGYRASLVAALDAQPGWKVVAECARAAEALGRIPAADPDVILLDIRLPDKTGTSILPLLKAQAPRALIVMLTVEDRPEQIVEALENGACGYILKGGSMSDLRERVREVLEGGATMSPAVARHVAQWFQKRRATAAPQADFGLSERQWEILQMAARGKQRGEIALALEIELNTVKNHFRNIFKKLHAHTLNEAILKVRQGQSLLDER